MKCAQARIELLDRLDAEDTPLGSALTAHLAHCPACRALHEELAVGDLPVVDPAPSDEFNQAVWQRLRTRTTPSTWTWSRLGRYAAAAVVAVAALVGLLGPGGAEVGETTPTVAWEAADIDLLDQLDELALFEETEFLSVYLDWEVDVEPGLFDPPAPAGRPVVGGVRGGAGPGRA